MGDLTARGFWVLLAVMALLLVLLQGCERTVGADGRVVQVVPTGEIITGLYQFWNNKQAQLQRELANPATTGERRLLITQELDRLENGLADFVEQLKRMEGYEVILTIQVVPGDVAAGEVGNVKQQAGPPSWNVPAPAAGPSAQFDSTRLVEPRTGEDPHPHADGTVPPPASTRPDAK